MKPANPGIGSVMICMNPTIWPVPFFARTPY